MEALYILIPFSVILVFAIAVIFWMSVRGGQFDDLEGPGFKILMDNDLPQKHGNEADKKADSVAHVVNAAKNQDQPQ